MILYELLYDSKQKICGSREAYVFDVPEELGNFSSYYEFSKDNRDQTEIILIDEQRIYMYDFSSGSLVKNIDFNDEFGFTLATTPNIFVLNSE